MGYSYRTTQQSAGRVNDAAPAPSADAAQEVAQSATIRCPRCRTEQEIIFNYATLGGGLGACVGPANRKQPCAECGSPPDEPCQRVFQNTIDLPASKNYSNTPPAAQPAEPPCTCPPDYDSQGDGHPDCVSCNLPAEPPATDDLVRDLNERAENDPYHGYLHRQAADLIERQAREIERWRNVTARADPDDCAAGIKELYGRWKDAEAEIHKANIDSANMMAECSDLSVDVEKYRQEIAALRLAVKDDAQWAQENERLTRELDRVKVQLTSEITAALAERDALRADAERYRWIRRSDTPSMEVIARKTDEYGVELYFGDELDAAIDAARAKVRT